MRRPTPQAPLLWQAYLGFWIAGVAASVWLWPALCCALLLTLADRRLWRLPRLAAAGALLLSGLGVALWQLAPPGPAQSPLTAWTNADAAMPPPRICGLVRDVQGLPDQRLRLLLADVRPQGGGAAQTLPGLTAWTWEEPLFRPLAGQTLCLSRRPRAVRGFSNTGLADWEIWWAARGVRWRLWSQGGRGEPEVFGQGAPLARWREALRAAFLTALLPDGQAADSAAALSALPQSKAMLPALLFGDRHYLNQHTLDNFAAATLAHSLALSGQHLAVAGLLGLLCVLAAARLRPSLYLARPRAILALAAACPPALVYLWLGNAPASLLRAVCMLFVLAFWLARSRARTTLDVLCAALLCICVAAPLSVLDTGLQLSALCVAVIGLALPWLRRVAPPRAARNSRRELLLRLVRWPLRILLVSLLIQTALLPLNLLLFGNAGFWFPLNMLWLPMAELIVLPGAALGPLLRLEQRASHEIRLDALDVGQGQALLLRAPGHLRLLLDGGGSVSSRFDPGKALTGPALTYNDAPRLTAVLNSHPDMDHLGGLFHLLDGFQTRALFHNGREAVGHRGEQWREVLRAADSVVLAEGDTLVVGDPASGLMLEVLHPPRDAAPEAAWTGNDASLILRLTRHGQGLALFTGDAERRSLRRLLASGHDLRARVLVAPHHGSDRSFLPAFYKAVQPELVLVSCGFQNRYNYPGKRLRAWLGKNGIPLLHTGESGQISVVWPADGPLRVRTRRAAPSPAKARAAGR